MDLSLQQLVKKLQGGMSSVDKGPRSMISRADSPERKYVGQDSKAGSNPTISIPRDPIRELGEVR